MPPGAWYANWSGLAGLDGTDGDLPAAGGFLAGERSGLSPKSGKKPGYARLEIVPPADRTAAGAGTDLFSQLVERLGVRAGHRLSALRGADGRILADLRSAPRSAAESETANFSWSKSAGA